MKSCHRFILTDGNIIPIVLMSSVTSFSVIIGYTHKSPPPLLLHILCPLVDFWWIANVKFLTNTIHCQTCPIMSTRQCSPWCLSHECQREDWKYQPLVWWLKTVCLGSYQSRPFWEPIRHYHKFWLRTRKWFDPSWLCCADIQHLGEHSDKSQR